MPCRGSQAIGARAWRGSTPTDTSARQQVLDRGTHVCLRACTQPRLDDRAVGCDLDRRRLIGHPIHGEDALIRVEAPLDGTRWHQYCGLFGGGLLRSFPSRRHERHPVSVFLGQRIDDGQLPSTRSSPLGPEHHEHRSGFLRKDEGRSAAEVECEIWRDFSVGVRGWTLSGARTGRSGRRRPRSLSRGRRRGRPGRGRNGSSCRGHAESTIAVAPAAGGNHERQGCDNRGAARKRSGA